LDYVEGCFAFIGFTLSFIFVILSNKWILKSSSTEKTLYWLGTFSFIASIQYLDFLYVSFQLFYKWHILYYIADSVTVLLPLFAYGYMRSHQGHNILMDNKYIPMHLIPSFIILTAESDSWLPLLSNSIENNTNWIPSTDNSLLYWCMFGTSSLFYWCCQRRYGHSPHTKMWVELMQSILLVTGLSVFIKVIATNIFTTSISMVYTESFISIYFVYIALSSSTFSQSSELNEQTNLIVESDENKNIENRASTSKQLTTAELTIYQEMFNKLEQSLKDGTYQDNELSIGKLAEMCNLTKHQASIAINHFSGTNFYEWVRQYRITISKDVLAKTTLPVSTIYYDVGFNSKSSFYNAFKKLIGCTPTEYRKSKKNK
jgi:AraC-like DNA-binding protein